LSGQSAEMPNAPIRANGCAGSGQRSARRRQRGICRQTRSGTLTRGDGLAQLARLSAVP
jgi:hypothetical protein